MGTVEPLRDIAPSAYGTRLRLLAPLRYLAIKHSEKLRYDVLIPSLVGLLAWIAYSAIQPRLHLFGDDGLLRFARDLLIMAVPFMVGALAAVSMGAPGPHLDRRPLGTELYLGNDSLTLRQFLCYLLGYLSFIGLVTLILVVTAGLMREPVLAWTVGAPMLRATIKALGSLSLLMLLSYLSVTVFWSLYFLTDVANQPTGITQELGSSKSPFRP
jgi:hypothetical protein